jgi:hypothetical protein
MAEHSLAIHSFETRLSLTGPREDAPPLGREVGRMAREFLPAAISAVLEPLLGSRDGVLRINRIALTLRVDRGEMSALRLADLLAREIAWAIAERAKGIGGLPHIGANVAYWPDHASFAAAYLAHRLGLAPSPDWVFADFRPLAHVAAHEAAMELIAARPAILVALARLLGATAAPALAASVPEQTATLLIERLLNGLPAALPAGAEAQLATMIAALPVQLESDPARAAIAVATTALATRATVDPEAVREVVMLARIAVALAALRAAAIAAWGRASFASDLAPEALVHLPEPVRSLAQVALAPLTKDAAVRTALARLLDRARRRDSVAGSTAPKAANAATATRAITSRFAGIGLLIPSALNHALPDLLSPAAFNRTLAAAAGPETEGKARLDPLLAALAPFDPRDREPAFPPVPETLRAAIPEALREGVAELEGSAGWAACLIHAFAASLGGFEASSLRYLRLQFLARPGTLHVAEDRLTLVLDPLPLGIVLRLSGMHGWTGRLPQLRGAPMRIEIRES